MNWHGDQLLARVRSRLARNLGNAAGLVADKMVESINGPYPPASAPGDPPHRRTGELRASIAFEVDADADALTARAGSTLEYAGYLEHGTDRMAARPFARPALLNNLPAVRDAVVAGVGRPTD